MQCSYCNSTLIDHDSAQGDATCMNCGRVISENVVVSEVTFQDNGAGGSGVIGQFIAQGDGRILSQSATQVGRSIGRVGGASLSSHSREQTKRKGKDLIRSIGSQLRLSQHIMDSAQKMFNLAVERNFTRGRKLEIVIAAAVYTACRYNQTPHMIIDVSFLISIDGYTLGTVYKQLRHLLQLKIPQIDPSLYIHRCMSQRARNSPPVTQELGFGASEEDKKLGIVLASPSCVSSDALKIVSSYKRDWLHTGRRPGGICGAALLIAARMNGYRRSVKEVASAVKVGESTIKKRVDEFVRTPASKLTREEFINMHPNQFIPQDPPSYSKKGKKLVLPGKHETLSASKFAARYKPGPVPQSEEVLSGSDIDDEELSTLFLSAKESKRKRKHWTIRNKDWLEKQEKLKKLREERIKNGLPPVEKKPKKKRAKQGLHEEAPSAPAAVMSALQNSVGKRNTSKINFAALEKVLHVKDAQKDEKKGDVDDKTPEDDFDDFEEEDLSEDASDNDLDEDLDEDEAIYSDFSGVEDDF